MSLRTALWLLPVIVALAAAAAALPPIAQPPGYHEFADQRGCFGLPNCLDTASNALFVIAGAAGLLVLGRLAGHDRFRDRRESVPWRLFFAGVVLIGFGSGYYHLAPDNGRLVWDRLPMMLAFMSWLCAVVGERLGMRFGLRLLPVLLAAGPGSVLWWSWTESQGAGDLRPYLLMQLYPMLLVPALLRLERPAYSGDGSILAVIGLYGLALLFDIGDRAVFAATGGWVSGHTLKHVVAACAVLVVVRHLQRRQPL